MAFHYAYEAPKNSKTVHDMQIQYKKDLVSTNNVIKVGTYEVKWSNITHHLAYKRLLNLSLHSHLKCSLPDLYTGDWEEFGDFNIISNDKCFEAVAKRALIDKHHLVYVKCMGCNAYGVPTTDNNPAAWHYACWRICLDSNPKAAYGYTNHLAKELAPRIHKQFPNLSPKLFRALYETCEDRFWLTLFDLKTKNRYRMKRINDKTHTYTGILGDFSLEQMKQNPKYEQYVLDMLSKKDWWFSMNIQYSCISYQSFIEFIKTQTELSEKPTDSNDAPNANNQANKPQF